jgi:NO-binding membrane sensor protein with MHYT domain
MSDADALLADLWAQDDSPAQDPAFVIAVMQKVERERFRLDMAWLVIGCFAAGLVFWAFAPLLDAAIRLAGPLTQPAVLAPVAAALAMAAFLWSWTSERAHRALP